MALPAMPSLASDDPVLERLQVALAKTLSPLLSNVLAGGILLTGQVLATGSNTINHGLGRTLVGWVPVRLRASATLYDTQDTNPSPDRTLVIVASAPVTVDLYVC